MSILHKKLYILSSHAENDQSITNKLIHDILDNRPLSYLY